MYMCIFYILLLFGNAYVGSNIVKDKQHNYFQNTMKCRKRTSKEMRQLGLAYDSIIIQLVADIYGKKSTLFSFLKNVCLRKNDANDSKRSISPTFYEQLLRAKIPKAQKAA